MPASVNDALAGDAQQTLLAALARRYGADPFSACDAAAAIPGALWQAAGVDGGVWREAQHPGALWYRPGRQPKSGMGRCRAGRIFVWRNESGWPC